MSVFIDVTGACRSPQNTGMQRMTRMIFAELGQRLDVRPISWNTVGNRYTELGSAELGFLTRPFETRSGASARPEFRGEDPLTELWRLIRRHWFNFDEGIGANDFFLVPDIYRDSRRKLLPDFIRRTPARTVAIFHDAADLRLTDVYPDREKKTRPYVESLALFDLVICVSEEARDDLHHFWKRYGCDATETCVEPWPGEMEGARPSPDDHEISGSVLYVSSFHARKNHLGLFRAAEKLWREGLNFELELVGRNVGAPFNKVVRAIWKLRRLGRPIRWLRHVNDEVLLRSYRECRFTVYPSLMEGFGLPIAESLWHGKPCICGGNGALGEIARGGGCLIVDQTNTDALADGIKTLLQDRQLYERLANEARTRKFRTWSDYIERLLGHLQPRNAALASN